MEFNDVLKQRYSCRQFSKQNVSNEEIRIISTLAQQVPSWGNTQPWKIYVANGETAYKIRQKLIETYTSKQTESPDIPMPSTFSKLLKNRYIELGKNLFKILNINRESIDKQNIHYINNYNAFGAPALVYITIPEQTSYILLDIGAYTTTFCLVATNRGLSTCILAALARYPQIVRNFLPIPLDEKIVIGIALGYSNINAPVNKLRSNRVPIDNILTITSCIKNNHND